EQRELAKIALEYNLTIITDEAYEYFTFDGKKHFSVASIPEMKDNVITNYTFTKSYAMTGWRIGYLHASEKNIAQIKKAHIPLAICAPVASQYAAIAALKGSQDIIKEFRLSYIKSRDLMCERLDRLDNYFQYIKPEGAYLMFPKILGKQEENSLEFSKKLLAEAKVSTTPGVAFGPTGEGHVRLSFCVPEEMINKAFDRIEKFFKI
ncbi:MAG: aminotransferase class I/II-fold pyridoxal phosphate-dependent enzyme, partial [Bacteroidota bacterium]|nr:aminotransferase class I/II-fold pyridoxal phosphate-dependent enzyme [Bacteroidota bacterium]